MKPALVLLTLLISISGRAFPAGSDRLAEHDLLLQGLDVSRRNRPTVTVDGLALATADGDDIRVSLSTAPARFDQDNARLLQIAGGDWWVVWEDARYGSRKIFRQRFDSLGVPPGGNELLAGSGIGADYTEPRLGIDTLGRIYFAWRDQTGGMIFVTRFAANGSSDWSPRLVNDTSLSSFAGPFDLAVFRDGQVVLVWEDYSALGSTIRMRIYSANGSSLAGPTVVNSDGASASHWVPAVAHAPGSGFLVCWEDYRNGQADIYARQFTGAGNPVGSDFVVVPPPASLAAQYAPRVVYSSKDRYVIGWTDLRQGQEIYLQRFNPTTGLVGDNRQISSGHALVLNRDLDLSVLAAGRIHVLWNASGIDNTIQSLMLDSGLVPAGFPDVVNRSTTGQRWAPTGGFDKNGGYTVVWTESTDNDPDIVGMLFDPEGAPRLADELVANDDSLGAHSTAPRLAATTDWWNLVCYVDQRNDQGDIFVRTMSNAGDFLGGENRVNQDPSSSLQAEPGIASTGERALLVWNDARTLAGFSGQRIYGRFLTPHGAMVGSEFLISDGSALQPKSSPKAALHSDASGMVTWLDRRDGSTQVYARWLAADGNLDGGDFRISQTEDVAIARLVMGRDNSDHAVLLWFDPGSTPPSIRGRRFNPDRTLSGSYAYAPTTPTRIEEMAADVGPDGRIAIFWIGSEGGTRRGYVTLLDAAGSIIAGPIVITDSPAADPSAPSVSVCNNNYLSLTWLDRRDGRSLGYYQILEPALSAIGSNLAISTHAPEFMERPMTDAFRGRAWFLWSDPRADGLNVYANAIVYLPTSVDDEEPSGLPSGYRLAQNYPNPFNPTTEIEYSLPEQAQVKLEVLNALGQTVSVLVEERQAAGAYHIVWDGTDFNGERVASGIYLYRLKAGPFSATRKMVLLK